MLPTSSVTVSPRVLRDVGWVDAGRIVTSGGLSAGISMALHLVDRLVGRDLAVACARQIGYPWTPADGVSTASET